MLSSCLSLSLLLLWRHCAENASEKKKASQGFRAPLSLLQSSSAENVTVIVAFVKALSSTYYPSLLYISSGPLVILPPRKRRPRFGIIWRSLKPVSIFTLIHAFIETQVKEKIFKKLKKFLDSFLIIRATQYINQYGDIAFDGMKPIIVED